jgi:hypothetical protein
MDCYVVGRLVDDMDGDGVSLGDLDRRTRELSVHHGDQRLVAQVRHLHLAHLYHQAHHIGTNQA